jgi:hypothetical protein
LDLQRKALLAYNNAKQIQKKLVAEYKGLQEQNKKRHSDNVTRLQLGFDTTQPKPRDNRYWYRPKWARSDGNTKGQPGIRKSPL